MENTVIACAAAALIGYLLGCSNMALYLSKITGVDVREKGSQNLGTCNAFVCFGFWGGLLVFLHDAGKAVLAVWLCRWLFPAVPLAGYVAGAAAVVGHAFPFWLRFKGGKGFAAFLGMILAVDWRFFLIAMGIVVLFSLITNYIVVGTVIVALAFPVLTWFVTRSVPAVCVVCAATVVILIRHSENIIRIAKGTEIGVLHRKEH